MIPYSNKCDVFDMNLQRKRSKDKESKKKPKLIVRSGPFPPHLADGDDSLLRDFVSEDVKHVHAVSADDRKIHFGVLPNVSVGRLDPPQRSSRLG